MSIKNIFYQGEGLREIQHLEAPSEHTVAMVRELIIAKHGIHSDSFLFLEDCDDPLEHTEIIEVLIINTEAKLHVHRCLHVEVSVAYAGKSWKHSFSPSTTIARVKREATEHFGLTPNDATEHMLQIAGTHERPTAGSHIGSLTTCPNCKISFDLVPDQRVNG